MWPLGRIRLRQQAVREGVQGDTVELAPTSDKTVTEVARDLEVSPEGLRGWVKQAKTGRGQGPGAAVHVVPRAAALPAGGSGRPGSRGVVFGDRGDVPGDGLLVLRAGARA